MSRPSDEYTDEDLFENIGRSEMMYLGKDILTGIYESLQDGMIPNNEDIDLEKLGEWVISYVRTIFEAEREHIDENNE